MLTYSFENRGDDFLYECLYKQIKKDIKLIKLSKEKNFHLREHLQNIWI